MKKKILGVMLSIVMAVTMLVGCENHTDDATDDGSGGAVTVDDLRNPSEEDLLGSDIERHTGSGQVAESVSEEGESSGEAVFTAPGDVAVVLSEARLLREQTRASYKERLLEIINNTELDEEQKQAAVDNLIKMTEIAEKEASAEILLEAMGFSDAMVSINGDTVEVVVNVTELDEDLRAQIEDIVKRKTDIPAENIIITIIEQ